MFEQKRGEFALTFLNGILFVIIAYYKSNLCKIQLLFEFIFYFKIKKQPNIIFGCFFSFS